MKRLFVVLCCTAFFFDCGTPVPCANCEVDGGSGGGGGAATGGGTALGGGTGGGAGGGGGTGGGDAGMELDAGIDAGALTVTLVPSVTTLAVTEGATATLTLTLDQQPAAVVVVQLTSSDANAASVSPATMTFTTANWNVAQTITVSGVDDLDLANETATLTLSSPSADADALVTLTVTDDDQQTILIAPATISVNEGATATVMVSLSNPPAADVPVTVSSGMTSLATVLPSTLVFTTANYATPQSVTVTGVNDGNTVDDVVTVTASAIGATSGTLTVMVNDDDQLGIALDPTTQTMFEYASRSLVLSLTAQPAGNVTISVSSSDPGALTAQPSSFTFTPANWDTAQLINLDGVQDIDASDEVVTVTASATGLTSRTATITVTDDDLQRIVKSTSTLTVTEGSSGTVGVHLQAQPVAPVVVSVTSADPAKATVSPSTLTFTSTNFTTPQTITVTGEQDNDAASAFVQVELSAPGVMTEAVDVTVDEDDTQAVLLSTNTVNVLEGSTATFGVHLAYAPVSNTTVIIATGSSAVATVGSPTLIFTPTNYAVDQTVTVFGTQDSNLITNSTTIDCSTSGATSATLSVIMADDDTQRVVMTGTPSLTLAEGQSASVMVSLAFQPPAPVTVSISSSSPEVTAPAARIYTTSNWSTPQSVLITAGTDTDAVNDTATVNFFAPMATPLAVAVTITDTTIVSYPGFPTAGAGSTVNVAGNIYAYRITVPAGQTLDRLGLISAAAGGDFRLAVYTDTGSDPGTLFASTTRTAVPGAGQFEAQVTDLAIPAGTYWLALRNSPNLSVRQSTTVTTMRCVRGAIAALDDPWPTSYNTSPGAGSCTTVNAPNLFAVTWQQP